MSRSVDILFTILKQVNKKVKCAVTYLLALCFIWTMITKIMASTILTVTMMNHKAAANNECALSFRYCFRNQQEGVRTKNYLEHPPWAVAANSLNDKLVRSGTSVFANNRTIFLWILQKQTNTYSLLLKT